jgi:hypothetical protein
MHRFLIVPAILFAVSACSLLPGQGRSAPSLKTVPAEKPSGPLVDFAEARATPGERAACEASGGYVEMAGLLGHERCTRRYTDGGKVCSDSAECEGQCRAENASGQPGEAMTGLCTANDNPFGCYAIIDKGRSIGVMCVD